MFDPRKQEPSSTLGRRAFLRQGTLLLAGSTLAPGAAAGADAADQPVLRAAMITDLHYADKPPAGNRYYRETPRKFAQAAPQFHHDKVDFLIELGDLIDAADSLETEKGYLRKMAQALAGVSADRHYVLGNHCVYSLTKPEFLEIAGQPKSYYAFDSGGYHFIVLDACFRGDGTPYGRRNFDWTDANIPPQELRWLRSDLEKTTTATVVFLHQRLDVESHYGVKRGGEVRRVLEQAGNVLAVFQGHYHRNDYREIGGIHYCTLAAMVEGAGPQNNAYSVMDILPGDLIRIRGFANQQSYTWPKG